MKRNYFILIVALLFILVNTVIGQNSLSIENPILPQNGGEISVKINLSGAGLYTGYAFHMSVSDGIECVADASGKVNCILGEGYASTHGAGATWEDETNTLTVSVTSLDVDLFTGNYLTLGIPLKETDATIGTNFTITFTDFFLIFENGKKDPINEMPFTITIGEPADTHTILDETSTTAPEASDGPVDVRVKRTIKANQWSTICLPFAMTAAQMEVAFGADVELADFAGCDIEMDEYENTVGITIKFETTTSIEANHPYIIKVGEPITEFTVDGVEITPENEPSVQSLALRIGKGTKLDPYVYFYDYFIGTYVANTTLPAVSMFLNNNQFWYSTGATKMKGYRAYFALYFNLTDVENTYAAVKMAFNVDGIPTDIQDIVPNHNNGNTYDLNGRRIVKPQQKGVYIKDGKKAFIK